MATSSADAKLASLAKANRVLEDQLTRDTNRVPDPAEVIMGGTGAVSYVSRIFVSYYDNFINYLLFSFFLLHLCSGAQSRLDSIRIAEDDDDSRRALFGFRTYVIFCITLFSLSHILLSSQPLNRLAQWAYFLRLTGRGLHSTINCSYGTM